MGVFALIVCSYEIINLIYAAPGVCVSVFAWIVCSYESINLIYVHQGRVCVCLHGLFVRMRS